MKNERVKLSKKLFFSLKPGQYIMGNSIPLIYEEIGDNPEEQWNNWRMTNGLTVEIFDSEEECLSIWWQLSSGFKGEKTTKVIYDGKLSKKGFMAQQEGYWLLFTQEPFESFELKANRENQWQTVKHANGRRVQIFKNHTDCIMERNNNFSKF